VEKLNVVFSKQYNRSNPATPDGTIQEWFQVMYRRVWHSFTAAGDWIRTAKAVELIPLNLSESAAVGRTRDSITWNQTAFDSAGMWGFIASK
jgi:hypothetical protein